MTVNARGIRTLPYWSVFLFGMAVYGWMALPPAGATTYYVSLSGNDSYNGQSPAFVSGANGPFRTIQKAVNTSVGGDAIQIRGGAYTESVNIIGRNFSQALPLTIRNYGGEVVGISPAGTAPFWISGASWVQIGGLTLAGVTTPGVTAVYVGSSANIAITNCNISSNQAASAVYAVNSSYVTLAGNRFIANQVWPVQIDNNCVNCLVASNRIERTRKTSTMVMMGSNSRNNTVLANTFVDNYLLPGSDLYVIFLYQVGAGNTIRDNVIYNTSLPATEVTGAGSAAIRVSESDDVTIRGNLVSNYIFRGTVDFSWDGHVLTPAQGGRSGCGITVNGTTGDRAARIVVEGNTVKGSGNTGIEMDFVDDSTLRSNTVVASGQYGLHIHGDENNHSTVIGNVIEGNTAISNGWLHGGMSGISVTHVGTGNIIRRNVSFGNRQGTAGMTGYDWYGDGMGVIVDLNSDGTWVLSNLCFGNEGPGIGIVKSDDCVVLNNTIVGNGRCPQNVDLPGVTFSPDIGMGWTVSNTRFENNILYNNRQLQIEVFDVAGHVFNHNLFLAGPLTDPAVGSELIYWQDPGLSGPDWYMTFSEWKAYCAIQGIGNSAGDLNVNPSFAGGALSAANRYGYSLAKGSPCVNAGVNDSRLTGTFDLAGNERLGHGVADIGAIEYVTSGNTLFPVAFTGAWANVALWDSTGAFWWAFNGSGTVWAPTQITVPPILPNRWYWLGVWDYAASAWGYGTWFARYE